MRVTIAHDWLTNWAGSEQVVAQMIRVSGASELVTSIMGPQFVREHFPDITVKPLWPTQLPAAKTHWSRYALPMIAAWATTKIDSDALLVSSHFAAHGATMRFDGPSIVYYHTPARILWRPEMELGRLPPGLRCPVERLVLPTLRRWDRMVAQRPTVMLANSSAVAHRIKTAYSRHAEVLHPPVDVRRWATIERAEPRHLMWLGRLVAYKRPEVAIEASRRCGIRLVMIGDGPEWASLKRDAPPNVQFLGHASDAVVRDTLSHASGLVLPGEEDFGIAPVEALAAGVPVVAYAAGGALDYVRHGENGLLIASQDPDDVGRAMLQCQRERWNSTAIRRSAEPFSRENFARALQRILSSTFGSRWIAREARRAGR